MGPLIWYVNAQVRMWIILDINYKHYYHLGKSQICAGAGDYFRTSKPHSEKLWHVLGFENMMIKLFFSLSAISKQISKSDRLNII